MNQVKENLIKDSKDSFPADKAGGFNQEWRHESKVSPNMLTDQPQQGEETVKRVYDISNIINVGEPRSRIDDSKLIIPLHVDPSVYTTHEELYHAIKTWWVDTKRRSPKTVEGRIRYARSMAKHALYPVDWLKFEPIQILNQLIYRQNTEYKQRQEITGNPTYGTTQLHNLWKTVNMFAEAYGVDISFWGWNPPAPPEPQVKIVPRPETVNRLMHTWYTNDRVENALIRTMLTVGFHIGLRPEELITIKVRDIKLDDGYIFIREQKKKFRERQVWIDDAVLNSRRQNSLRNWIHIWRPKIANENSGDYLFIQKNGSPFPSEDALRMYLFPFVKPVWDDFKPKIMRDWSAIARLIRTKVETKKWDIRTVKHDLGHKFQQTTESYIRYAENYYRNDPYDWLRAVLKFHKHSLRMSRLMKQEYGPGQEISKISINTKKGSQSRWFSPRKNYGPMGATIYAPPLEILTNDLKTRLSARLHYSFFFSFFNQVYIWDPFFFHDIINTNPIQYRWWLNGKTSSRSTNGFCGEIDNQSNRGFFNGTSVNYLISIFSFFVVQPDPSPDIPRPWPYDPDEDSLKTDNGPRFTPGVKKPKVWEVSSPRLNPDPINNITLSEFKSFQGVL